MRSWGTCPHSHNELSRAIANLEICLLRRKEVESCIQQPRREWTWAKERREGAPGPVMSINIAFQRSGKTMLIAHLPKEGHVGEKPREHESNLGAETAWLFFIVVLVSSSIILTIFSSQYHVYCQIVALLSSLWQPKIPQQKKGSFTLKELQPEKSLKKFKKQWRWDRECGMAVQLVCGSQNVHHSIYPGGQRPPLLGHNWICTADRVGYPLIDVMYEGPT